MKKISTLVLAAMMAISFSAFAQEPAAGHDAAAPAAEAAPMKKKKAKKAKKAPKHDEAAAPAAEAPAAH